MAFRVFRRLRDLLDVNAASPSNGEVLTYNTATSKWINSAAASSGAPTDATYIVQTANGSLSAEQAMGALATGLVKNTTSTGVQSIATQGSDYYAPAGTDVALADGGTGASLTDPNADRIMFWDDSAGAVTWLTPGTNLTVTDTTLSASGGIAKAFTAGKYVLTVGEATGDSSSVPTKDLVWYSPFPVTTAFSIDRIALGVAAAGGASSVVRLGLYSTTSGGLPGTLIADWGAGINGTSATYQEITISQALTANTLYWIAVVWQVGTVGSGTVRAVGLGNGSQWIQSATNSFDPRVNAYVEAGVTGSLPATATPSTPALAGPATKVRIA